jgi:lipoprotein-anchoring transpeptidase ErfK/SrfK
MKHWPGILAGLFALLLMAAEPSHASNTARSNPTVEIIIDISSQSMKVDVNGWPYGRWKVSTAREGYHTPRGTWKPFQLKEMHYSRKYDNSPMPHSIFFLGGYAIHATYDTKHLGKPASHGCIRLHPRNAERLYRLVEKHGVKVTRITIIN